MPVTLRLDQTCKGFAHWTLGGNPVDQVNPLAIASSDPTAVAVSKDPDGGIVLHPGAVTSTPVTVSVTDSAGKVATDTVTVTPALVLAGSITWGTPTPA